MLFLPVRDVGNDIPCIRLTIDRRRVLPWPIAKEETFKGFFAPQLGEKRAERRKIS